MGGAPGAAAGRGQSGPAAADPRRQRPPDKPSPRPEPVPEVDSYDTEDTFPWKLIVVEKRPLKLEDVVLNDPNLKDDPRLKKYKQRLARGSGGASPKKIPVDDLRKVDSSDKPSIRSPDSTVPPPTNTTTAAAATSQSGFPLISEKTGMPSLPPLPGLSGLLENFTIPKPTDPRLSRQLSHSDRKKEETSPPVNKDLKPMSHRSDPRFRKKSKSTDTAPHEKDSPQDKPVKDEKPETKSEESTHDKPKTKLDFYTPISSKNSPEGNRSPSYGKYNRSRGAQQGKQEEPKPRGGGGAVAGAGAAQRLRDDEEKPTGSPSPLDPDMPMLAPILPEEIDAEGTGAAADDERSLKHTFSTLDPTASPFC